MVVARKEQAAELAEAIFPHLARYCEEHGASSTVVDGLFALAHVAAFLLCSDGVDTETAREGFIKLLDYAIATCPDEEKERCTLN